MSDSNRSNGENPRKIISEYTIVEENSKVAKEKNYKLWYIVLIGLVTLFVFFLIVRIKIVKRYENIYLHSQPDAYSNELVSYAKNLNRLFVYFDGYDSDFSYDEAYPTEEDLYDEDTITQMEEFESNMQLARQMIEYDYYEQIFMEVAQYLPENNNQNRANLSEVEESFAVTEENFQQLAPQTTEDGSYFNLTDKIILTNNYKIRFIEGNPKIKTNLTMDGLTIDNFYDRFSYEEVNEYINNIEDEETKDIVLNNMNQYTDIKQNRFITLDEFYQDGINFINEGTKATNSYADTRENYLEVRRYVDSNQYFKYYIYDSHKDMIYSNINDQSKLYDASDKTIDEYLKNKAETYVTLNDKVLSVNFVNYRFEGNLEGTLRNGYKHSELINESFKENGLSGYIITPKQKYLNNNPFEYIGREKELEKSIYSDIFMRNNKEVFKVIPIVLFILISIMIMLGFKRPIKESFIYYYKSMIKIPNKIKFAIALIVGIIAYFYIRDSAYARAINFTFFLISFVLFYVFLFLVPILIFGIIYGDKKESKILRRIKEDYILIKAIPFGGVKIFALFAFALLFVGTFCEFILIAFFRYDLMLMIGLSALYFAGLVLWIKCYNLAISYCKLRFAIENMYHGEEIELIEDFYTKDSITQLKNIEKGFLKSVEKMIKSEKMKAELITNVSHDLKTPLTSIINYVELLDSEGLGSNNAPDYLKVLQQKSQRLKLLIEDLFEVSKLSTGNAELETTKINIIDLLNQTVGELQPKLDDAEIILKFTHSSEEIMLNLDGKKIWRVFENLINNIIKYSMPRTRAYINLEEEAEKVVITFRNISNREINFEVNELFERFKRGDDSRSTEGNGLGLSIAQSIVILHNGEMDVVLDGDLFKVIIILNK